MPNITFRSMSFVAPTGVGFPKDETYTLSSGTGLTPKACVIIAVQGTTVGTEASTARMSVGITDGTTQRCCAAVAENNASTATALSAYGIDTASVVRMLATNGSGTLQAEASFVSFGTDSVTLNWSAESQGTAAIWFFFGDDLSANVTSFASDAVSGQPESTTAPGFQPDAVLAWTVGQNFVADGSGASARMAFGFAGRLPSVTQSCTAWCAENAAATATSSGVLTRNDALLTTLTSVAGVVTEGTRLEMTSFDATGFTITTRNASVALEGMYLSLKLAGAHASAWVETFGSNATGAESSTIPGFNPEALFISACQNGTVNTINSGAGGNISLGMAVSSTEETASSIYARDNQGTSSTGSITTTSATVDLITTTVSHDWTADFTSFDATGFTLNVSDASAAARPTAFFAIELPRRLAGSDTETIADAFRLLVTIERKSFADTEQIADEFLFRTTDRKDFGDTEAISDAFRLVVTSDARALSDDEQISDAFAFATTDRKAFGDTVQIADATLFVVTGDARSFSDTEQIADAFNFVVGKFLVADETVQIGDGFVLVSMGTTILISNDTEEISDGFVTVLAAGVSALTFVANETVELSDGVVMIRGQVLVSGDTEAISDAFNSGRGLIARKAIKRGRVF